MTPRVKCRRCSAMILEITASTNGGFCGSCVKTRGLRYRLGQIGDLFYFLGGLLVMPFIILHFAVQSAWRRWRFPFDRSALLAAIQAVHTDVCVAQCYMDGVVAGYWDSTPERQLFTRNQPRQFGAQDGGRLRRGEISVADIPIHRGRMVYLTKMPDVRYIRSSASMAEPSHPVARD